MEALLSLVSLSFEFWAMFPRIYFDRHDGPGLRRRATLPERSFVSFRLCYPQIGVATNADPGKGDI